jgi:hypothetical protein
MGDNMTALPDNARRQSACNDGGTSTSASVGNVPGFDGRADAIDVGGELLA